MLRGRFGDERSLSVGVAAAVGGGSTTTGGQGGTADPMAASSAGAEDPRAMRFRSLRGAATTASSASRGQGKAPPLATPRHSWLDPSLAPALDALGLGGGAFVIEDWAAHSSHIGGAGAGDRINLEGSVLPSWGTPGGGGGMQLLQRGSSEVGEEEDEDEGEGEGEE